MDEKQEAKGIAYYNEFIEDYLSTNYGMKNPKNFKINCLNPAHADNNPSMSYDRRRKILHCFSCDCGVSYDLIDLVQVEGHARSVKDAIKYLAHLYENKPLPADFNTTESRAPGKIKDFRYTLDTYKEEETEEDRETLIKYLSTRGFNNDDKTAEAIINSFHLTARHFEEGYSYIEDAGAITILEEHEADKTPGTKREKVSLLRLVIPQRGFYDDNLIYNSFNARLIPGSVKASTPGLAEAVENYKKARYRKPSNSLNSVYDFMQVLHFTPVEPLTIFITEGELDSLSVVACLYTLKRKNKDLNLRASSIALAGSNAEQLFNKLKSLTEEHRLKYNFILLADTDQPGQTFKEKLEKGLNELGVFNYSPNLLESLGVKDFSEAYSTANREELLEAIEKYAIAPRDTAQQEQARKKEEDKQAYINSKSALNFLLAFKEDIKTSERLSPTPTGFNRLDELFNGGIPKGLLTIGALSSLGKTTLILQLADQLAQQGQDILYFTLEMSKEELISKSLSRLTFLEAYRKHKNLEEASKLAKTNLGILQGNRYKYYSQEETEIIDKAFNDYSSFANRLYFIDSVATGGITINEIEKIILEHIEKTGKKPIILLDYLQIIKSPDMHLSDKQATDFNISALKRISAKNSLLIIAISSLNRASYIEKVDYNSFKESGAVEYTNDILIGLNFTKLYELEEDLNDKDRKEELIKRGIVYKSGDFNPYKLKSIIKEEKSSNPRKITLEVLKNRNGATGGTISFYYYPRLNIFLELIPPTGADEDFIKKGASIFDEGASTHADIETPLRLLDNSIRLDRQQIEINEDDLPF